MIIKKILIKLIWYEQTKEQNFKYKKFKDEKILSKLK